ncbi:Tim10/DDP family zinc finger-domain-containing protein [Cantharellus anzutake]|uniref:Tim10/DDP family zinc finger-domain-containing protein n=1 Tax=Cantharellus anzutake TaxID=1750568 RepID=UPI00190584D6|nr:Tim10/DDP family zinc finger-domain-containing protein [Cantharellus anzutake]KAF8338005.1 Tim10/DDP family zinc finger-domain-containing protein [Cantharellus anzutake]
MSFLGSNAPGSGTPDQAMRKQQLMDQVRREMQTQHAQALMEKINDKCFQKCITKPGDSLSTWEQGCLGNCMDRYMDAFNIVSRTYVSRLSQEASNSSSSSQRRDDEI